MGGEGGSLSELRSAFGRMGDWTILRGDVGVVKMSTGVVKGVFAVSKDVLA